MTLFRRIVINKVYCTDFVVREMETQLQGRNMNLYFKAEISNRDFQLNTSLFPVAACNAGD